MDVTRAEELEEELELGGAAAGVEEVEVGAAGAGVVDDWTGGAEETAGVLDDCSGVGVGRTGSADVTVKQYAQHGAHNVARRAASRRQARRHQRRALQRTDLA